ncbi:TRAP transporter substrate-binding protein [Tranquillimonas alkanivorans]|uniref:TRAP-type mannitol/chloroaromatic compound transport system, substrate-binding protein n=1 Tax=Tranquillimonas alkanivorans TaxID=441119 RepID=A0A1I5N843_9RHOB|nr:TRAP transporter substrate-binding protein [Tranquillimonas alkanivorans]SFP18075.1 TRAP-type mannitol/chloroaromatic compound transport system, substrate-binding protein [Tranquillimonas alkanivorans]
MTTRRKFLAGAAATAPAALAAPAVAQSTITWRMQTYAGPALAAHVVKPAIDMFNQIAGDRMQIELFFADQLVPTSELFRAMQRGTIDAVQSDDDSMQSPTEVTVFGGYFPFASRYSLDVPVLFNQYGLKEIWEEEYSKVGVKHVSAGAWDPCHFATKEPIRSLKDLEGKRVFTFPTAGRFLSQFGVVPVTLPWEDIEVAVQTGELDGIAWSGITEDYTVGWADVTNYFLTNNISGAWIGHFFANNERWMELPDDLKMLFQLAADQSHYYRQWWYWGGEARLRVHGEKMELTSIPDDEWDTVEEAARTFWDEIAAESETKRRVVEIFKQYNADMQNAGRPYRYTAS